MKPLSVAALAFCLLLPNGFKPCLADYKLSLEDNGYQSRNSLGSRSGLNFGCGSCRRSRYGELSWLGGDSVLSNGIGGFGSSSGGGLGLGGGSSLNGGYSGISGGGIGGSRSPSSTGGAYWGRSIYPYLSGSSGLEGDQGWGGSTYTSLSGRRGSRRLGGLLGGYGGGIGLSDGSTAGLHGGLGGLSTFDPGLLGLEEFGDLNGGLTSYGGTGSLGGRLSLLGRRTRGSLLRESLGGFQGLGGGSSLLGGIGGGFSDLGGLGGETGLTGRTFGRGLLGGLSGSGLGSIAGLGATGLLTSGRTRLSRRYLRSLRRRQRLQARAGLGDWGRRRRWREALGVGSGLGAGLLLGRLGNRGGLFGNLGSSYGSGFGTPSGWGFGGSGSLRCLTGRCRRRSYGSSSGGCYRGNCRRYGYSGCATRRCRRRYR